MQKIIGRSDLDKNFGSESKTVKIVPIIKKPWAYVYTSSLDFYPYCDRSHEMSNWMFYRILIQSQFL